MHSCSQEHNSADPGSAQPNGSLTKVDPQPLSPDLLGDLLAPLAIEGPPGAGGQSEQSVASGLEGAAAVDGAAIVPVAEQTNTVEVCMCPVIMLGTIVNFALHLSLNWE